MTKKLKATRFMRMPFIVEGHRVTKENMEVISRWCEGQIILPPEDDTTGKQPFIRVPVERATKKWMTEAYEDMWVLVSKNHRGENSFKVYTQEWMEKNFFVLPDEIEDDDASTIQAVAPPVDNNCCVHSHIGSNVRALPQQSQRTNKTTGNIRSIN